MPPVKLSETNTVKFAEVTKNFPTDAGLPPTWPRGSYVVKPMNDADLVIHKIRTIYDKAESSNRHL